MFDWRTYKRIRWLFDKCTADHSSLNSIFLKPETKQKKGSRHQNQNDVISPPYNLQLEMYFDIFCMYVNGLKHNRHKGPNV